MRLISSFTYTNGITSKREVTAVVYTVRVKGDKVIETTDLNTALFNYISDDTLVDIRVFYRKGGTTTLSGVTLPHLRDMVLSDSMPFHYEKEDGLVRLPKDGSCGEELWMEPLAALLWEMRQASEWNGICGQKTDQLIAKYEEIVKKTSSI